MCRLRWLTVPALFARFRYLHARPEAFVGHLSCGERRIAVVSIEQSIRTLAASIGDLASMLARETASPGAGASSNDGSSKLVRLLRKRLRQLALVTTMLAIALALTAGGVAIWWKTSLNGLPDIGDPFDVSAFRAIKMPDEQNAFSYYRRAQEKLSPFPDLPQAAVAGVPSVPWSDADPKLREWVGANGEALRLFLRGADQDDGIFVPGAWRDAGRDSMIRAQLTWLALLEGGRLEESGDMAGAWTHYRSVLRMASHLSRRMNTFERFYTNAKLDGLRNRLESWAADPRTTIPQIRRALDDVTQKRMSFDPDSSSLKRDYVESMRSLDDPDGEFERGQFDDLLYRFFDMQLPPGAASQVYAARRLLCASPSAAAGFCASFSPTGWLKTSSHLRSNRSRR